MQVLKIIRGNPHKSSKHYEAIHTSPQNITRYTHKSSNYYEASTQLLKTIRGTHKSPRIIARHTCKPSKHDESVYTSPQNIASLQNIYEAYTQVLKLLREHLHKPSEYYEVFHTSLRTSTRHSSPTHKGIQYCTNSILFPIFPQGFWMRLTRSGDTPKMSSNISYCQHTASTSP